MKRTLFFMGLFAPALFLLPACEPAHDHDHAHMHEVNMESVKAQITALENGYAVASNARDVDGVAKYYANDAQSLAPNEPTRVGMDAIKAGIRKDMEMDTSGATISFETTGVWAAGNYATETGTSTVKDKNGNVIHTGKYMTLFELRDGKYIAIRDIWNDDAPEKEE